MNPEELGLSPRDKEMMKGDDQRKREGESYKHFDALTDQYAEFTIHATDGQERKVDYKKEVGKIVAAVGRGTPERMTVANPAFFDKPGDLASYREKIRGKTLQQIQEIQKPFGLSASRNLGKEGLNIWSGKKEIITDANYRYSDASPRGKVRNALDCVNLAVSQLEIEEQKIDPTKETLPTDPEARQALLFFFETRVAILENPATPPEMRAKAFTKNSWDSEDPKQRAQNMENEKTWLEERIHALKENPT